MAKKQNSVNDGIEATVIPIEKLRKDQFITSSLCGSGSCVGVARLEDDMVVVQDTKDFNQKPLTFSRDEWRAFVAGVKNDEFNM